MHLRPTLPYLCLASYCQEFPHPPRRVQREFRDRSLHYDSTDFETFFHCFLPRLTEN